MRLYHDDADLYDAAFAWDTSDEVDWLLSRLGDVALLLEPACGSGRMFPGFARRGVRVVGIERSPDMARRARAHLESLALPPTVLVADITDFSLADLVSEPIHGAYCPINSFSYLRTPESALAHLHAVARHLRPGARYMIQLDIYDLSGDGPPTEPVTWETAHGDRRVRTTWAGDSFDPDTRLEIQTSRIEVLDGPGAGDVVEDQHTMLLWDWPHWKRLIADSPFDLAASHPAANPERPELSPDRPTRNAPHWHELTLP